MPLLKCHAPVETAVLKSEGEDSSLWLERRFPSLSNGQACWALTNTSAGRILRTWIRSHCLASAGWLQFPTTVQRHQTEVKGKRRVTSRERSSSNLRMSLTLYFPLNHNYFHNEFLLIIHSPTVQDNTFLYSA